MDSEDQEEIEKILKVRNGIKKVYFIKAMPFRKQKLLGDLAYSFLKIPNNDAHIRVIRVVEPTPNLIGVMEELFKYIGEFKWALWTNCGRLYMGEETKLNPRPIYTFKREMGQLSVSIVKHNVNFFSTTRSFLLKAFILNYYRCLESFNILQFSKDYNVPQSTAQNFKKTGIETRHLKINKLGKLSLVNIADTLEEWSFKQDKSKIYYVKHLFDDKPLTVVKNIANKSQKHKVALGAYLTLNEDHLYPVNIGEISLYVGGDLKGFLDENQLLPTKKEDLNAFQIRVPTAAERFFEFCEPHRKILKLDKIQCFLDFRHGVRGEEIKDFLLNRVFKNMNERI